MRASVGSKACGFFGVLTVAAFAVMVCVGCEDDGTNIEYGSITDARDGKAYRTVEIGEQTWMAENLNYTTSDSWCYDDDNSNCAKYGRLYTWDAAMTACPDRWHLPSDAEWTTLTDYVGGVSTAGKKLKANSGWYGNGNGTDDYGFSALPGGVGYSGSAGSGFHDAGSYGNWWSTTENDATIVWGRNMDYDFKYVYRNSYLKTYLLSVRCVQDN